MMGGMVIPKGSNRKESKEEKRARKNRPFVDMSLMPDDPPSANPAVNAWRAENEITTAGRSPEPFLKFEDVPCLTAIPQLWSAVQSAGFERPSVIQSQAWPACMEGRDVIGVAKTGSGKTLGFLVPAFINMLYRRWGEKDVRNGPQVLVLAPTRELATQIFDECVKFGRSCGIRAMCAYGGDPKRCVVSHQFVPWSTMFSVLCVYRCLLVQYSMRILSWY